MKIKLILLTLITMIVVNSRAENSIEKFDAVKLCEQDKEYQCHGACLDGWARYCYYDSSKVNIEPNKLYTLFSQKDGCYGYHNTTVCEPCQNIYQIENKEVSCTEFYDAINKKNEECNGCLKATATAGG